VSLVKGPNALAGYVQETQHREVYGLDGRSNRGDLGSLDEQGYFWLTGRVR
jgi:fatty-acyl-CoA synthase